MVLLFLAIAAAILMVMYSDIISQITFMTVMWEWRVVIIYPIEFNLPITYPQINNLWVFGAALVGTCLGFVVVWLDSGQALDELGRGHRAYVVWPRRLGWAFWNDLVNAHRHESLSRMPFVVAWVVWIIAIIKTILGLLIMLLSWLVPIVAGLLYGLVDYVITAEEWSPIIYAKGLEMIKYMGNEFGVFLLMYALIVIVAGVLHTSERTFYNDYAIMQHQRK